MTPETSRDGEERRHSGGSISKFFRALTRRGTADPVSKKLSFSPTKDEQQSQTGVNVESTATPTDKSPVRDSETTSASAAIMEQKEKASEQSVRSVEEGVEQRTGSKVGETRAVLPEAGEVIPTTTSPVESGLQSETSPENKVKAPRVRGREVKSRFLNSIFSSKDKPARAGSVPRRAPSEDPKRPKREASLGVEIKKQVANSPKGKAPGVSRSGSASRRQLEQVESRNWPAASGEGHNTADGACKTKQRQSTEAFAGSTKEPKANGEKERLSGGRGNGRKTVLDGSDQTKSAPQKGDADDSKRPEEAVLEAVRDRLSLLGSNGLAADMSAVNRDEERRKERAKSGEAASTKEGVASKRSSSAKRRSGGGEAPANRKSWSGSAASGSLGSQKTERHADRLTNWQELKSTKVVQTEEGQAAQEIKPRPRKPSQLLLALRDQSTEQPLQAEGSMSSIGTSLGNSTSKGEATGGSPSTTDRKARGVVVPSRVWLDGSKKDELETKDRRSKSTVEEPVLRPEVKDTNPGLRSKASVSALQRAPFAKLSEAGHWLPSSPHKNLKPSRSAATSDASTPSESRAATPSGMERGTVSAPASPSQTARTSRRSSGSAPASPKQPRARSRSKTRPLGGQEEVGASPGRGVQKSNGARHVRVLHNRWLQWCFVNAKAREAQQAQQRTAEASLYSAWQATSDLRASVASQKTQLHRERHGRKLDALLAAQTPGLERWRLLEQEHRAALTGTVEALEATMLRVPLTNGAFIDPPRLRSALADAKQAVSTTEPIVHAMLPKATKAEALLSQLAETAAQERALLRECRDLLTHAATLEVEERSLRAHLIQLNRERQLGRPMPVLATPMRQPTF